MNFKVKRWLPFIVIILIALIMSLYMFLNSPKSDYKPTTDKPTQIYREACSSCHGVQGQGEGLLFPALTGERLKFERVEKIVVGGALFMPAFKYIKGDTLSALARYILAKDFVK